MSILGGIGAVAALIGGLLMALDLGSGRISVSTDFDRFRGEVGPVALILGVILMSISLGL